MEQFDHISSAGPAANENQQPAAWMVLPLDQLPEDDRECAWGNAMDLGRDAQPMPPNARIDLAILKAYRIGLDECYAGIAADRLTDGHMFDEQHWDHWRNCADRCAELDGYAELVMNELLEQANC
jgi:hypothetical protein